MQTRFQVAIDGSQIGITELMIMNCTIFLFAANDPAWFCNLAKQTSAHSTSSRSSAARKLKEFVMRLHTGESISAATSQWTWKQREQLGQQMLTDLAADILNKWHKEWKNLPEYEKPNLNEEIAILLKSLELDGYVYKNEQLLELVSKTISVIARKALFPTKQSLTLFP